MVLGRILVVARDQQERDDLEKLLLDAKYDARAVGDVMGAYWMLRGFPAALVLLDGRLPREDRDELRTVLGIEPRLRGVRILALDASLEPEETLERVREALARG